MVSNNSLTFELLYVAEVGLERLILFLPAEILGVLTTFNVIFNIKELDIP